MTIFKEGYKNHPYRYRKYQLNLNKNAVKYIFGQETNGVRNKRCIRLLNEAQPFMAFASVMVIPTHSHMHMHILSRIISLLCALLASNPLWFRLWLWLWFLSLCGSVCWSLRFYDYVKMNVHHLSAQITGKCPLASSPLDQSPLSQVVATEQQIEHSTLLIGLQIEQCICI